MVDNAEDKRLHGTCGWVLSEDDVRKIKMLLKEGMSVVDVARACGVDAMNIYPIKSGRTWRHVECAF